MIFSLLLVGHLIYLLVLEFVVYPEFFIFPYLASAGWLPYKQIIDSHFPGLWLMPINFFTLGFNNPESYKILLALIIVWNSFWIFRIARELAGSKAALMAVAFYAVWQPFFSGSHLWLELIISPLILPAYYYINQRKWLITGILLGMALLFKQTVLPLLLIPVFFSKPDYKYFLGLFLPWIPILIYFKFHNLFSDFFYWTVYFNFFIYAPASHLLPTLHELLKLLLPFGLFLYLFPKKKLLSVWILLSFVFSQSRFDFEHFQAALPFFCIALGLVFSQHRFRNFILTGSLVWSLFFTLRHAAFFQTRFFSDRTFAQVNLIKSQTHPGDIVFLLGSQPLLYPLTQTYPPDHYFSFHMPWYISVNQNRLINSLKNDPPKLVIFDPSSSVDGVNITQSAPELTDFVKQNYLSKLHIIP
jgi:hypothetical protein